MTRSEPAGDPHYAFLEMALELASANVAAGGGPFGAIVVKDGKVIATGGNRVTPDNDPTAHAEVVAIRAACRALGSFQLHGCEVYSSCEPCPMCLGAIYWSRPKAVYFAATHADASGAGFDDTYIYSQICTPAAERKLKMVRLLHPRATESFDRWRENADRIEY